jgi:multimeric flavodoxin WrbA
VKVLLVNGSPHKEGCTYVALSEVTKTLKADGIETETWRIFCGAWKPQKTPV